MYKLYQRVLKSCLKHGSETWLDKMQYKQDRTKMNIIRWTCGFTMKEDKCSTENRLVVKKVDYRGLD